MMGINICIILKILLINCIVFEEDNFKIKLILNMIYINKLVLKARK